MPDLRYASLGCLRRAKLSNAPAAFPFPFLEFCARPTRRGRRQQQIALSFHQPLAHQVQVRQADQREYLGDVLGQNLCFGFARHEYHCKLRGDNPAGYGFAYPALRELYFSA